MFLSHPVNLDIIDFINHHEGLVFALSTYVIGLSSLNLLEKAVNLMDFGSTFPKRNNPLINDRHFTKEDVKLPWILPHMMDHNLMIPTLEMIQKKPYLIHVGSGIAQYISTMEPSKINIGLHERSKEWSNHFDCDVYICKKIMK
tara:strand:- start:17 stop:448 length:432 start_codon:yes stop_codon:yes gene_type:complete